MLTAQRMRIGIPVALLAAVAIAALALWMALGGSNGGLTDSLGYKGTVSWELRDAAGNLKQSYVGHNATLDAMPEAAAGRLGITGVGDLTDDDLLDNIQACSTNASGVAADCTLSANLNGDGTGTNPGDGANTTPDDGANEGKYQTVVTFTAGGASTIEELQLTKGAAADDTKETVVGAWQNVSITLAGGDTLQVTWTVTVTGS